MSIKILRVFVILLMIGVVLLYACDVLIAKNDPLDRLLDAALMIASGAICLYKLNTGKKRRSLDFYEKEYHKEIENAFAGSFINRKRLLCAIRFYNEDNFRKAVKLLSALKPKCRDGADYYAVGVFLALVYTDVQYYDQAIILYHQLINMNLATSTVYGNLGYIYSKYGEGEKALSCLHRALEFNPRNAYAQHNIAKFYFDKYDFDNAVIYAEKALELDTKLRQAASMLAVIYAIKEDREQAQKYFHIAVTSGERPEDLKNSIEFYRKGKEALNDIFE